MRTAPRVPAQAQESAPDDLDRHPLREHDPASPYSSDATSFKAMV